MHYPKTANLAEDIYEIPWYKMNKQGNTAIQLMLMRSQAPSGVSIPFFDVNLPTFANVSESLKHHSYQLYVYGNISFQIVNVSFSYITFLQFFLEE